MRPKRKVYPRRQQTPEELLASVLEFVERKFYAGDRVAFIKDRKRLLSWVVLRLATWLDERGVTLSPERYREILVDRILMEAVLHGNTYGIRYRPAWLGKVVESHLRLHGEDYYEEAKSLRNLADSCLSVAAASVRRDPDPVRELARAASLVKSAIKGPVKRCSGAQLLLF